MDIKDILGALGLDLTNPEVRRGATDAIAAILDSRNTSGGGGGGTSGNEPMEIEIDPDLIQPSIKQQASSNSENEDDIEVEDEDNVLDDLKFNDSDEPIDNNQDGSNEESKNSSDDTTSQSSNTDPENEEDSESEEMNSNDSNDGPNNLDTESEDQAETESEDADDEASTEDTVEASTENTSNEAAEDTEEDDSDSGTNLDSDSGEDTEENKESEENEISDDEVADEDEFDEEDLVDSELKNNYDDEAEKTKAEARRIKRERTLAVARNALDGAKARKASPALIRELENAIEALEALTEAVQKSLKDISDGEFNILVNRVLDAVDALGNSGLTYKSEEERALQAQEIKNDLANSNTRDELDAEDIAKIRAEHQAIKAREKENAKYAGKARTAFKGFQDFLMSLYRAIALQVATEETRDDTWSAINRRHSGSGVLMPGKRFNDLPNKKIPIIDFYFDCSSSWTADDIEIGKKAVEQLVDMEEKGQIKINLYYFADRVSTTPTRGGTSGWNEIVKNIITTQATNVVIMTDSDMEDWWTGPVALKYTVPGFVWYLWRDGENAPRLPRDLNGRGGTLQFSFTHGDL